MPPPHDLKYIRARFAKGFETLKNVLRSLKESYAAFEKCNTPESRRTLNAQVGNWRLQCKDFQERLPKRLPPFVRDGLWNKRGIGKRVQIGFKLKKGFPLKELGEEQRAEIKEAGGRELWRLPPWQVTSDTFTTVKLTADWPDLEAIEQDADDAFETYVTLAEKRPEDFRLWPRLPEETAEEVVEVVTRLDVLAHERIGKHWPDGSDEQAYAYLLRNAATFDSDEPTTGATFKRLSDSLRNRWPDINGDQISNGILDAYQKGLIRAFGGEAAHKEGYAPEKVGEIVDRQYLSEWLGFDYIRRPFEIVFRLRSDGISQAKGETAAVETPTGTPKTKCSHSPDFSSVRWFGTRYTFSKGYQAAVVKELWKAWECGGHSLAIGTLTDRVGAYNERFQLAKVFRSKRKEGKGYDAHPAWTTMIQQSTKGCYRLVAPDESR